MVRESFKTNTFEGCNELTEMSGIPSEEATLPSGGELMDTSGDLRAAVTDEGETGIAAQAGSGTRDYEARLDEIRQISDPDDKLEALLAFLRAGEALAEAARLGTLPEEDAARFLASLRWTSKAATMACLLVVDTAKDATEENLERIKSGPASVRRGMLTQFIEKAARVKMVLAYDRAKQSQERRERIVAVLTLAQKYLEDLNRAPGSAWNQHRVAPLNFAMNEQYLGSRDLAAFSYRVVNLFKWHSRDHKKHVAPYFPMIQSSGMGKTKIMLEYHKQQADKWQHAPTKTPVALRILCQSYECDEDVATGPDKTYDHMLQLRRECSDEVREKLLSSLDSWVAQVRQITPEVRVVLLFDEAQNLLPHIKAWAFRVVRRWLRLKRSVSRAVVAVFAGTSSALADLYYEPPVTPSSREVVIHHSEGAELYEPFFSISTIGCFQNADNGPTTSEYEKAIPYGRPLFTLLHRNKILASTAGN
jgi:hypothetical protein